MNTPQQQKKVNERARDKFELYILSLWLLFILIIVVTIKIPFCVGTGCRYVGTLAIIKANVTPLLSIFLVLWGWLIYRKFDAKISANGSITVKADEILDLNYEHLTFLTTYIIPLICFNLTSLRYLTTLGLLLIVIGIIYVKTDKFYANPTLALLGFQIYQAMLTTRTGEVKRVVLIAKDRLGPSENIQYRQLDEKVYFARKI